MSLSKTFLSLGIAVVFAAFAAYALNVIYPAPEYDYSANDCYLKYDCYAPVRECESRFYNASNNVLVAVPKEAQECSFNITQSGEYKLCQKESDNCNKEFEIKSPQYAHAKITFAMLLVIGLTAIISGSRMRAQGVGSGFIGGGVLLLLWSLVNSWMYVYHLDRYFKLAGLGVALAVLVYVANKKFSENSGKKESAESFSKKDKHKRA